MSLASKTFSKPSSSSIPLVIDLQRPSESPELLEVALDPPRRPVVPSGSRRSSFHPLFLAARLEAERARGNEAVFKDLEERTFEEVKVFITNVTLEAPECFIEAIDPVTRALRVYFFAGGSARAILEIIFEYVLLVPAFYPRAVDMVGFLSEIFGTYPLIRFNENLAVMFAPYERYDVMEAFRTNREVNLQMFIASCFWLAVKRTWQLPALRIDAERTLLRY